MSLLADKNPAPKARKSKPKLVERKSSETKSLTRLLEGITIKKAEGKLFTEEEVSFALDLAYSDGNPFLRAGTETLYEFIGGCEKYKREAGNVMELLELLQKQLLVTTANNFSAVDGAPWFGQEKGYYDKEIKRLKTDIVIKKGIFKCPRCLASKEKNDPTNTETVEIQTRKADEPATNFNSCNTCNYRWKV